jgi:hypothetical protein
MKVFGERHLVRALTDEQIAAMRDLPALVGTVKLPTIEDAVKAGGFLAGRPEDIIEALKAVEKRYPGLDRVICATPLDVEPTWELKELWAKVAHACLGRTGDEGRAIREPTAGVRRQGDASQINRFRHRRGRQIASIYVTEPSLKCQRSVAVPCYWRPSATAPKSMAARRRSLTAGLDADC